MSDTTVQTVLVVGAGAIGTSWAAHFLLHDTHVVLADPNTAVHAGAIQRVRGYVVQLDDPGADAAMPRLTLVTDPVAAAPDCDLVIEAGPERLDFKRDLFAGLDAATRPEVLLTSSSSGLMPSSFADACTQHPERVLVAHPFNPPHLVPLVELVAAPTTSAEAMARAEEVFHSVGKRTIRVQKELPGPIVNRLQAALWREAYHLIDIEAVSVADLDLAIANGPGLRWALAGPFATQHLSGGGHGIGHILKHLGPPMVEWWDDLGHPELSDELIAKIVAGVDAELGDDDEADLLRRRDAALVELLHLKVRADLD